LLGRWVLQLQLRSPEFGRCGATAGSRNSLCLTASGEVYTWGWNQRGTLGHGHKKIEREPCKVAALAHVKIVQVRERGGKTA
jgi:alpha-tubulin suppressor-like RCC1 family protein